MNTIIFEMWFNEMMIERFMRSVGLRGPGSLGLPTNALFHNMSHLRIVPMAIPLRPSPDGADQPVYMLTSVACKLVRLSAPSRAEPSGHHHQDMRT